MQVRWFAGAAAAAGVRQEEVDEATGTVLGVLAARHPGAEQVLGRCTFLLDGRPLAGDDPWPGAGDVLDVLPPFTGG